MDERTEGQLRVIRKVISVMQAAHISAWLFGGWGLDARIGRITRQHGDVSVAGPGLAASAIRAGLVDEYQLFVTPVMFGGGTSFFPEGVRAGLDLVDQRRFASGVVYLRYRTRD